jgi:sulfite oxidase
MEIDAALDTTNRPDEWMIEQGMAGHKLPILDQTGSDTIHLYPPRPAKLTQDEEAIRSVGNRTKLFARERQGWKGYCFP